MTRADPIERFLADCRQHEGMDPSERLRESTRQFVQLARHDRDALRQVGEALPDLPAAGAAWVAVSFGSAVEGGADVESSGAPLLSYFIAFLSRLPEPPASPEDEGEEEEEWPAPTAEQEALLETFPFLCQGVVAHLARMPAKREALAQDEALLERLDELQGYSHGACWVREAILRTSNNLTVLHPTSGKGLLVEYANVANCFHLFSLLQACIGRRLPGGRNSDQVVAAVARGEESVECHDSAWWHFGDPQSPTPDLMASIWGEMPVRALPLVEGQQVILLWPPILHSRGWDGGFFGPHIEALPANAVVKRELTRDECDEWLQRLGIEPPKRPKWWLW